MNNDIEYVVRRLTPAECQRLQGFPDGYTDGLENENPSDEEIEFWKRVFENYDKPKNEKYIRKWLANPKTDAAEYKMWGNGWALPNALYFMEGIKEQLERSCTNELSEESRRSILQADEEASEE